MGDAGAARDAGEVRGAGVGEGSVFFGEGRGVEAKHVAHRVGRQPRDGPRPIFEPAFSTVREIEIRLADLLPRRRVVSAILMNELILHSHDY